MSGPLDKLASQRPGGAPRIDPRYGLLHKAMNLRRNVRSPNLTERYRLGCERELRKLLERSNVTEAEIDAHEADVEANGSPLSTTRKEPPR